MITKELIQTLENNFYSSLRCRYETESEYVLRNIKYILNEIPKMPTFEEFTNVKSFKTKLIDTPTLGLDQSQKNKILNERRRDRAVKKFLSFK